MLLSLATALLVAPPRQYARTALERNAENLAIACGQYDAVHGNAMNRGAFLRDPGKVGHYLYLNEYCASIGSPESLQLVLSIGKEPRTSQSQINRVFGKAYDDSYNRTLTLGGRIQMKIQEIVSKLRGH